MRQSPSLTRQDRHVPQDQIDRGDAAWQAREQQVRQEQEVALWREQQMANRETSPTGIVRPEYRFDDAKDALGSLNRKLDEAIDQVARAFQREAAMAEAAQMTREDNAQRAPILNRKNEVR